MLDHQDRAVGCRLADQRRDQSDVLMAETGHRLVEQQHHRIERQCRRDFERPLAPIGQFNREHLREPGETHGFEQRIGPRIEAVQDAFRAPEMKRVAELSLQRHTHVVAHRQMREHRGDLERTHHAAPCDVGRTRGGDVVTVIDNAPGGRL